MRGIERLVEEYSWMRGMCSRLYHSTKKSETFRYRCPSSVFFDNRFRSADCQKIQLPLGGSQGEETMRLYHPTYSSIPSACRRMLSAPTGRVQAGLACNTVTGRVRAVPYRYNPRSVIVRRFRRPCGWQQRSYGAAALPEKRFHSFRPHPPGTPGNHPGKIPA